MIGTITGAAAAYFASKYTDQRRGKESRKQRKKEFLAVKDKMVELIAEMKADLSTQRQEHIREFWVVPNKRVMVGGGHKARLVYYEESYNNLRGKLDILENNGYIVAISLGATPIYRMVEHFIELVRQHG